jgi:hypothetical protein
VVGAHHFDRAWREQADAVELSAWSSMSQKRA